MKVSLPNGAEHCLARPLTSPFVSRLTAERRGSGVPVSGHSQKAVWQTDRRSSGGIATGRGPTQRTKWKKRIR